MASSPPTTPTSPSSSHQRPSSPSSGASPVPPPVPVETHPNRAGGLKSRQLQHQHHQQHQQQHHSRHSPDPARLAPEDAYFTQSPPRLRQPLTGVQQQQHQHGNNHAANLRVPSAAAVAALRPPPAVPGLESKPGKENWKERRAEAGSRGRGRRRKKQWKKLMWVKQSYPDNYTDTETFLDRLQRNPRLRPYDFWPLVSDFTVIVQHVCSVVIFVCCFALIFQERVSPITVVSWGSICTILGWVLWDFWVSKEQLEAARLASIAEDGSNASSSGTNGLVQGLGLALSDLDKKPKRQNVHPGSRSSVASDHSAQSGNSDTFANHTSHSASNDIRGATYGGSSTSPGANTPSSSSSSSFYLSPRNQQRLVTAKSGLLIFCALQGLSPILKSLTKSTTSDSIWAMSCWLMIINIFFFDYGSSEESSAAAAKFPASLSTNAALMASTVLASRLKSPSHVFSLTLFSIEVFGLFPVFRRHLRVVSWRGHVLLTVTLVVIASAAVGITLRGGYSGIILGILIGCPTTALAMGFCSWWLIGLQRYKNVVTGPWDEAKPVLRGHWD